MSSNTESRALSLLQPDLLNVEELIVKIKSRCSRIENLEKMSKEGLVEIFRRLILPLPQRLYQTNRRGKMLSSRRAKAGLENKRKEQGSHEDLTIKAASSCSHRLKPASDISHKIGISTCKKSEREPELHKMQIKSRKLDLEDRRIDAQEDSSTSRKITLKRPSSEKSSRSTLPTESKRQRTPIKWP